jgi:hypothetical protein
VSSAIRSLGLLTSLGCGQISPRVTVVSQNRFNYAEIMVMGVKTKKPVICSNARGIGVISVVELTRIELATS